MMDMTGAPCITVRFDEPSVKKKIIDRGELWRQILRYDKENYCMSASTPGELSMPLLPLDPSSTLTL
jgi:hypothetical protein